MSDAFNPDFVARINGNNIVSPRVPLVRAYVHQAGLDLWGGDSPKARVAEAARHLNDVLMGEHPNMDGLEFLFAFLWGEESCGEHHSMVDFIGGFNQGTEWPGNPSFYFWQTLDKSPIDIRRYGATCGDGLIVLGDEEKWRRKVRSFDEYRAKAPPISFASPKLIVDDYSL